MIIMNLMISTVIITTIIITTRMLRMIVIDNQEKHNINRYKYAHKTMILDRNHLTIMLNLPTEVTLI